MVQPSFTFAAWVTKILSIYRIMCRSDIRKCPWRNELPSLLRLLLWRVTKRVLRNQYARMKNCMSQRLMMNCGEGGNIGSIINFYAIDLEVSNKRAIFAAWSWKGPQTSWVNSQSWRDNRNTTRQNHTEEIDCHNSCSITWDLGNGGFIVWLACGVPGYL